MSNVTVAEAAKILGRSRRAIYDLISSGRLLPVHGAYPIRIPKKSLHHVRFGRRVPKHLWNVEEVAKHFRVTPSAIRHHIANGKLKPYTKVSGRWYFDPHVIALLQLAPVGRPRKSSQYSLFMTTP